MREGRNGSGEGCFVVREAERMAVQAWEGFGDGRGGLCYILTSIGTEPYMGLLGSVPAILLAQL